MTLTKAFLRSLSYPQCDEFDSSNPAHIQALIIWLEHTKIRHYPADGRSQLQAPNAADWQEAFKQYLMDIGCPLPLDNGANTTETLDWLLSHAVGLEYEDKAKEYNLSISQALTEATPAEDWLPPRLPPFTDTRSLETQNALRAVLTALHLEPSGIEITSSDVVRARSVLETQILPTLVESERQPDAAPTSAAALARLPLGFSTGDPSLDIAATVLRLLYIKDLRSLQTQIDEAIVAQQEMTANPRTDAAAGRVGR